MTTKKDLADLADNIALAARENACLTVRENHPVSEYTENGFVSPDLHTSWRAYFEATAEGIIDPLTSDAGYGEAEMLRRQYGVKRPLTAKQAAAVRKAVLG